MQVMNVCFLFLTFHFCFTAPAIDQERIIIFVQVRVCNLVPVYNGWESVDEISLPMGIAISNCEKDVELKRKLLQYCMIRYLCLKNSGLVTNHYDRIFASAHIRNFFVNTERVVEDSINKFANK